MQTNYYYFIGSAVNTADKSIKHCEPGRNRCEAFAGVAILFCNKGIDLFSLQNVSRRQYDAAQVPNSFQVQPMAPALAEPQISPV